MLGYLYWKRVEDGVFVLEKVEDVGVFYWKRVEDVGIFILEKG